MLPAAGAAGSRPLLRWRYGWMGSQALPPGPQQLLSVQSLKVQVVPGRPVLFVQVIEDPLVLKV